jgi:hypothetical protein
MPKMLVIGGFYHTESLKKPKGIVVPQKNFNSKNRATRVIVILVKDYAV